MIFNYIYENCSLLQEDESQPDRDQVHLFVLMTLIFLIIFPLQFSFIFGSRTGSETSFSYIKTSWIRGF